MSLVDAKLCRCADTVTESLLALHFSSARLGDRQHPVAMKEYIRRIAAVSPGLSFALKAAKHGSVR